MAMNTSLKCPFCKADLKVVSGQSNISGDCPSCGQSLAASNHPMRIQFGSYQGTYSKASVINPVASRLTLIVNRHERQTVHGRLIATGEWEFDLEFQGAIDENGIHFTTTSPDKKLSIQWTARIQGDCLEGDFSASRTRIAFFGTKQWRGQWQCRKQKFPAISKLVLFAKYVCNVVIACALIVGVAALVRSNPAPSSSVSSSKVVEAASLRPLSSQNIPQTEIFPLAEAQPPQPDTADYGYTPRFSPEMARHVAEQTYDFVLDRNRVDVSGYWRGESYVDAYTRRPPGSPSFSNKVEATVWSAAAVAIMIGWEAYQQNREERSRHKKSLQLSR